jgi:AdoMet-dependent heme synthase
MLSRIFLKDIANEIPKKKSSKIRSESFGKTIFNIDNLKLIYVDQFGFFIYNSIDGNKTVINIFDEVSKNKKLPKSILSVMFLNYLSYFQKEEFIEINKLVPSANFNRKITKQPLISAPNQISWIITNQCNLRCSHCANKNSMKLENELSTKEAIDFVKECSKNGTFILNISGGEPFARRDLFEILTNARELGLEIGITTNGTLIDENVVQEIKKISPFNIHISFDGIREVHDKFRNKKGVFDKVMNSIRLFKKYNIPFGLTTSISKLNFHNLHEIKEFVKNEKIRSWEIYYAIPIGNLSKDMALSDEEFVQLAKKVSEYKKELSEISHVFVGDSLGYFCEYNIREEEWQGCLAGLNHCAIGPEGEIKGCPIQPDEFIEGNIRDENFIDIWRDKNSFKYNRNPSPLEKHCKKCKYSKQCKAGCKTSMYNQHKKLTYNNLCVRHIESRKT